MYTKESDMVTIMYNGRVVIYSFIKLRKNEKENFVMVNQTLSNKFNSVTYIIYTTKKN